MVLPSDSSMGDLDMTLRSKPTRSLIGQRMISIMEATRYLRNVDWFTRCDSFRKLSSRRRFLMVESFHSPLSSESAICASDRKVSMYSGMVQRSNIAWVRAMDEV